MVTDTSGNYGPNSLAGMQDNIEALTTRYNGAQKGAERKELARQIAAVMSDYNEEVGFLAYDENKYK